MPGEIADLRPRSGARRERRTPRCLLGDWYAHGLIIPRPRLPHTHVFRLSDPVLDTIETELCAHRPTQVAIVRPELSLEHLLAQRVPYRVRGLRNDYGYVRHLFGLLENLTILDHWPIHVPIVAPGQTINAGSLEVPHVPAMRFDGNQYELFCLDIETCPRYYGVMILP